MFLSRVGINSAPTPAEQVVQGRPLVVPTLCWGPMIYPIPEIFPNHPQPSQMGFSVTPMSCMLTSLCLATVNPAENDNYDHMTKKLLDNI
jgi:hypothetical protein